MSPPPPHHAPHGGHPQGYRDPHPHHHHQHQHPVVPTEAHWQEAAAAGPRRRQRSLELEELDRALEGLPPAPVQRQDNEDNLSPVAPRVNPLLAGLDPHNIKVDKVAMFSSVGEPTMALRGVEGDPAEAPLDQPLVLKVNGAFEAGVDGCVSRAAVKKALTHALGLDYLPADVRYCVLPVWEDQLQELLPRRGKDVPLLHVQWRSVEECPDPETAFLTLHEDGGDLVFARITAALREICVEYPNGRQKLLDSLVRVRIKNVSGKDALARMKCEVKPVVLAQKPDPANPETLSRVGRSTITAMPLSRSNVVKGAGDSGENPELPDLRNLLVDKPAKDTASSLAELKVALALGHGAKGCFTKAFIKFTLLTALRIPQTNLTEEVKDFIAPYWEEKIRLASSWVVPFDVNWASLKASRAPDSAVKTLHSGQGDALFRRVAGAVESLAAKFGPEGIATACEGFVAVVIENAVSKNSLEGRKELFVEELDSIADANLQKSFAMKRPVARDYEQLLLEKINSKLSRHEKLTANAVFGDRFAVASVDMPGSAFRERLMRRFILRVIGPFEDGIKGCFTQEEIRACLASIFQTQIDRARYFEIIHMEVLPLWEGEIRRILGETIPFLIDWRSFSVADEFSLAVETIVADHGSFILERVTKAIATVCARFPKAIKHFAKALVGIVIELSPDQGRNSMMLGLHDAVTGEPVLPEPSWGKLLVKHSAGAKHGGGGGGGGGAGHGGAASAHGAAASARGSHHSDGKNMNAAQALLHHRSGLGGRRVSGSPLSGPGHPTLLQYQDHKESHGDTLSTYHKLIRLAKMSEIEPAGPAGKGAGALGKQKVMLKLIGAYGLGSEGCFTEAEITNVLMSTFGVAQLSRADKLRTELIPAHERRLSSVVHHRVRYAVDWDSFFNSENFDAAIETLSTNNGDLVFGRIGGALQEIVNQYPLARKTIANRLDFVKIKLCPGDNMAASHCKVKLYVDDDVLASNHEIGGALGTIEQNYESPTAFAQGDVLAPKVALKIKACFELGPAGCPSQRQIRDTLLKGMGLDQTVVVETLKSHVVPMWEARIEETLGAPVKINVNWESFRVPDYEVCFENLRVEMARAVGAVRELAAGNPAAKSALARLLTVVRIKNAKGKDPLDKTIKVVESADLKVDTYRPLGSPARHHLQQHHAGTAAHEQRTYALALRGVFAVGAQGMHSQEEMRKALQQGLRLPQPASGAGHGSGSGGGGGFLSLFGASDGGRANAGDHAGDPDRRKSGEQDRLTTARTKTKERDPVRSYDYYGDGTNYQSRRGGSQSPASHLHPPPAAQRPIKNIQEPDFTLKYDNFEEEGATATARRRIATDWTE
jgi:hypothetical protein